MLPLPQTNGSKQNGWGHSITWVKIIDSNYAKNFIVLVF